MGDILVLCLEQTVLFNSSRPGEWGLFSVGLNLIWMWRSKLTTSPRWAEAVVMCTGCLIIKAGIVFLAGLSRTCLGGFRLTGPHGLM